MRPQPGDAILVPAKDLAAAKSRLGARLDAADRRGLVVAMLADVLRATAVWTDRYVITGDAVLAETAAGLGCLPLQDPGAGLNAALRAGTRWAAGNGAARLLVLPSDVPLVSGEDLAGLFDAETDVVVAASADGGTTALLRTPPDVIEPAFGPGSAGLHTAAARRAGHSVLLVTPPSLRLDVDRPADLERLAAAGGDRESVAVARRLIGSRTG